MLLLKSLKSLVKHFQSSSASLQPPPPIFLLNLGSLGTPIVYYACLWTADETEAFFEGTLFLFWDTKKNEQCALQKKNTTKT